MAPTGASHPGLPVPGCQGHTEDALDALLAPPFPWGQALGTGPASQGQSDHVFSYTGKQRHGAVKYFPKKMLRGAAALEFTEAVRSCCGCLPALVLAQVTAA